MSVAGFIAAQGVEHGIPHATACRALGLSQAWFYKWRHGDPSPRRARREQLRVKIKQLFAAHKGRYGSPRIHADLVEAGWSVSVNTVAAIMAEQGLQARRKRRRRHTTRPGQGRWRAPDLVNRQFSAAAVNQKWFGDGTEILTEEGKLYLDSVLDIGSRRIVGFALGEHHDADLAKAALQMAVAVRGGREVIATVIFHSDQGGEYTGHTFRAACTRMGITQSMGRSGSALDNAAIESWHSTLEFELRRLEHYPTKAAARAGVAAFIDDYNRSRRHSALQMRSPIDFELGPQAGPVFRPPRMVPSSPASRPSPAGGLRPALTPAPGGTDRQQSKRRARTNKIKSH